MVVMVKLITPQVKYIITIEIKSFIIIIIIIINIIIFLLY